jgi:hypothetical protein
MPFEFETQPRDGYLLLTASGRIESVEDAVDYLKAILTSARKAGFSRVLVDERNASRKADQHDCITCANLWTSGRPPSGIRVAAVYSPAEAKEYHWIETILQNRAIICRIFDEIGEAKEWLMS